MSADALSGEFKVLYDQWGAAIANKQYDWFDRHFAPDFLGTAQPWPSLSVNKDQMIDLDKAIEQMEVEWLKVTAHRYGSTVITIGVVKYNNETFKEGAVIADGMPSGREISGLTHGKMVAYLNGWRHNGTDWQVFDHHMVGIVDSLDP